MISCSRLIVAIVTWAIFLSAYSFAAKNADHPYFQWYLVLKNGQTTGFGPTDETRNTLLARITRTSYPNVDAGGTKKLRICLLLTKTKECKDIVLKSVNDHVDIDFSNYIGASTVEPRDEGRKFSFEITSSSGPVEVNAQVETDKSSELPKLNSRKVKAISNSKVVTDQNQKDVYGSEESAPNNKPVPSASGTHIE